MQNKNYINNEWVDASDGQTFDVENPYTEETIDQVPNSKKKDVFIYLKQNCSGIKY